MKIGSLFRIDFAHQLNKELGIEIKDGKDGTTWKM
jgi:hypothetical protein